MFRIKPQTFQRCSEGAKKNKQKNKKKPFAHQDPEKGAVASTGVGVRPAFECLSVSCRGRGQQRPAMETGALAAADLVGTVCGINPLGKGHH